MHGSKGLQHGAFSCTPCVRRCQPKAQGHNRCRRPASGTSQHVRNILPLTAVAQSEPVSLEEDVQAYIADWMEMLREYRRQQHVLGCKASQLARELTSPSHESPDWSSKQKAVSEAAQQAGITTKQMAELVGLRKRLLHEMPRLRAKMAESTAKEGLGRQSVKAKVSTNCNSLDPQWATNATNQWVKAKQYRSNHAHPQSGTAAAGPVTGDGPATSSSWISRLGFSDMVRLDDADVSAPGSSQEAQEAASWDTSPLTQDSQALTSQQHTAAQAASAPALTTQGLTASPSEQVAQQPVIQLDMPAQPEQAARAGPGSVQIVGIQGSALSLGPSPALAPFVPDAPKTAVPGLTVEQKAAAQEEDEIEAGSLAGVPSRLRTALSAALAYKKQAKQVATDTPSAAVPAEPAAPESAQPYESPDLEKTVERARFDVLAAPRRSRADPDEAALLVCP